MAFHGQHPFQYTPQPQPQQSNTFQPPFGPAPFSTNSSSAPASFNDLPLPGEQGAFATNDAQSYDLPQNAGPFRAFSSQLMQLESRLEGRFQEIRLRAESADSAIAKLENTRNRTNPLDRAIESRLEDLENRSARAETSLTTLSRSLQGLTKTLDELDLRAERSADDAYAMITLIIDIVTRQLEVNRMESKELQQYQQRGEQ